MTAAAMSLGVTGATGFLGSRLCRRLVADGHRVLALRRPGPSSAPLELLGVESIVGDVTDPVAVGELVRRCDAVFHAAAFIRYGQRFAREHQRVNVEGTSVVARACRAAGAARLVHVSSVAAIGLPEGRVPVDETFSFNLQGPSLSYHASKHRAEAAVLDEVRRGLDAVIVNPSAMLGPYDDCFRGSELPWGVRRHRIVPYFIGGTNVVHVDDVVAGIVAALRAGVCGRRYILGGENLPWLRMAQIVAEELAVRRIFVPVIPLATAAAARVGAVEERLGRSPRFTVDRHRLASRHQYYDSERARIELGYTNRTYREIVKEYLNWTQDRSRAN